MVMLLQKLLSDLSDTGFAYPTVVGDMPECVECRLVNDLYKKGQLKVRVKEFASGSGASTSGTGNYTKRKASYQEPPA